MEKFKYLLAKLNSLAILQKEIAWDECIPEDIWNGFFKDNYKEVTSELDVDKHRHYEKSTSVIKIYGKFMGIRHISDLYSEQSCCEDCYINLSFFEMEEVKITSYIKK